MNLPQIAHVIFNSTKVRTFTECDRITFQGTFKAAGKKQQERPLFWKVLNVYQSQRCSKYQGRVVVYRRVKII